MKFGLDSGADVTEHPNLPEKLTVGAELSLGMTFGVRFGFSECMA